MKKEGFTLIEMLVVVAVIAILSGITLTGIGGFTSRARDTERIGDLRNIQTHLELFFNKCGHYPGVTVTGARDGCGGNLASWSEFQTKMNTAVGADIPTDPLAGKDYYYAVENGSGFAYILGADLENDNRVLADDLDDVPGGWETVGNIDCDDTGSNLQYCIGS